MVFAPVAYILVGLGLGAWLFKTQEGLEALTHALIARSFHGHFFLTPFGNVRDERKEERVREQLVELKVNLASTYGVLDWMRGELEKAKKGSGQLFTVDSAKDSIERNKRQIAKLRRELDWAYCLAFGAGYGKLAQEILEQPLPWMERVEKKKE